MTLKRKSRYLGESIYGAPVFNPTNGDVVRSGITADWDGIQMTESEGHKRSKDGRFHEGGPFLTVSVNPDIHYRNVYIKTGSGLSARSYKGPIVVRFDPIDGERPFPISTVQALDDLSDSSYLDPVGAEAISIIDPTNSNAEAGTALGEIMKDRRLPIPGIQAWKRRTELAKAAGSEYLNAAFGWIPLISDIKDTAQSVIDGSVILENYHNASGSWVHREFEFPHIDETSESVVSSSARARYLCEGTVSDFHASFVPLTRKRRTFTRRFFSGAFTYKAAGDSYASDLIKRRSDAEKLFGLTLDPDTLWELTPWSWAIDWFSNASNVIHNIGAFTQMGLVMKYGYIMEESIITDTYSIPSTGLTGVGGTVPPLTITYKVKRRREANPFGFGIGWEDLSPSQLAITAALGILRLR